MSKIKLYLVDDQILFVDMLTGIIEHRTEDMIVVGSSNTGRDVVSRLNELQPDILLLDVRMPEEDGISVLEKVKSRFSDLTIVMLTTFQDVEKAQQALQMGASGFLLKNMSVNDLIEKIRTISKGDVVISSQIAEKMFNPTTSGTPGKIKEPSPQNLNSIKKDIHDALSKRELEVYELLVQGYSNSEIAEKLFIARQTVKNHIYSIYSKIGYHDRFKIISDNH